MYIDSLDSLIEGSEKKEVGGGGDGSYFRHVDFEVPNAHPKGSAQWAFGRHESGVPKRGPGHWCRFRRHSIV